MIIMMIIIIIITIMMIMMMTASPAPLTPMTTMTMTTTMTTTTTKTTTTTMHAFSLLLSLFQPSASGRTWRHAMGGSVSNSEHTHVRHTMATSQCTCQLYFQPSWLLLRPLRISNALSFHVAICSSTRSFQMLVHFRVRSSTSPHHWDH